jgi:hypothetical protein
LLHIRDDDMHGIRQALVKASELLENKRYRGAYDELCSARSGLHAARDLFSATANSEPVGPPAMPMSALVPDVAGSLCHVEDLIGDCAIVGPGSTLLSVHNTFLHFKVLPEAPAKRSQSEPTPSSRQMYVNTDKVAAPRLGSALHQIETCMSQTYRAGRERQDLNDELTCTSPTLKEGLPRNVCELTGEVTCKRKRPRPQRKKSAKHRLARKGAEEVVIDWMAIEPPPVRNSFIHFDQEVADEGSKQRSQSAPASSSSFSCQQSVANHDPPARDNPCGKKKRRPKRTKETNHGEADRILKGKLSDLAVFKDSPTMSKLSPKRSRSVPPKKKWGGEEDLASVSTCADLILPGHDDHIGDSIDDCASSNCAERFVDSGPTSPLVGEHCFVWVEPSDKLHSKLSRLMRKVVAPVGEFVFTILPDRPSPGRACTVFQGSGGCARVQAKCCSGTIRDAVLSIQLGNDTPCARIFHDFSKNSICRVPNVLDLWSAVDVTTQCFTISFRFAVDCAPMV